MFEERYDDQWEKANDGSGNGSKGAGKGQGKGTKGDGFGRQKSRQGPPGGAVSPVLSAQVHMAPLPLPHLSPSPPPVLSAQAHMAHMTHTAQMVHMAVHGVQSDFAAGLHLFASRQWRA